MQASCKRIAQGRAKWHTKARRHPDESETLRKRPSKLPAKYVPAVTAPSTMHTHALLHTPQNTGMNTGLLLRYRLLEQGCSNSATQTHARLMSHRRGRHPAAATPPHTRESTALKGESMARARPPPPSRQRAETAHLPTRPKADATRGGGTRAPPPPRSQGCPAFCCARPAPRLSGRAAWQGVWSWALLLLLLLAHSSFCARSAAVSCTPLPLMLPPLLLAMVERKDAQNT